MKNSLVKWTSFLLKNHLQKYHILPKITPTLLFKSKSYFSNKSPSPPQIPAQNLQIKHEQAIVGEQHIDSFRTKGAISILDHIKGTKQTQTGQLYALMFTCAKCNTKSIRSFTKNAYHNGVVLIRCEGCQNIHLVADNIGWFGPGIKNLQNMGDGKIQKVHDPVAITRFIKAAFGDQLPNKQIKQKQDQNKQQKKQDKNANQMNTDKKQ